MTPKAGACWVRDQPSNLKASVVSVLEAYGHLFFYLDANRFRVLEFAGEFCQIPEPVSPQKDGAT